MTGVRRGVRFLEDTVVVAALLLLVALPMVEMVLRSVFRTGILGQSGYILHLVLVVGFAGGMITARNGRHLSMAGALPPLPPLVTAAIRSITALLSVVVGTALAWSSLSLLLVAFPPDQRVGIVPIHLFVVAKIGRAHV